VAGKTIVEHTIEAFEKNQQVDEIIIIVNPLYKSYMDEIVLKNSYKKVCKVLNGGDTRRESSYIGIRAIDDLNAKVLVHDAVRPFISDRIIEDCIAALDNYQAVDVAIPSADTIIKINNDSIIANIPQRKYMMRGQTPQAFHVELLRRAHSLAESDSQNEFTDDCGLILQYRLSDVYVVQGEERNIKITYPEDIFMADKLFQLKSAEISEEMPLKALRGKVIVVFGASEGIGKAIMDIAVDYGAKTYGFSRSNGVNVASADNVSDALTSVYNLEQKIDYIVNTAGILKMGKIDTRDMDDILEEINVNYIGSINIIKCGIQYLKESRGSILLFTSSSYTRGRALYSIYSSTKAAIVNLVQATAEELAVDNIRINAINPERTDTPMRRKNFGKETKDSLLEPEKVALASLRTLASDLRGQIIDVRKNS
jgi:2-C-methyl-D-erythritol 4-phosphate cytidylyltransferase